MAGLNSEGDQLLLAALATPVWLARLMGMNWLELAPGLYRECGLMLVPAMWSLLMPLALLLLGQTFRRAKVRKVHLVRLWVWSLPGAGAISVFFAALTVFFGAGSNLRLPTSLSELAWSGTRYWYPISLYDAPLATVILDIGWLGWFVVYWWAAIRVYLRLDHAPWVLLLLMLMTGLGAGWLSGAVRMLMTYFWMGVE